MSNIDSVLRKNQKTSLSQTLVYILSAGTIIGTLLLGCFYS